jgi:hypothetical protein
MPTSATTCRRSSNAPTLHHTNPTPAWKEEPQAFQRGPRAGFSVAWLADARASHSETHRWMLPTPIFALRRQKGNTSPWLTEWCATLEAQLQDPDGSPRRQVLQTPLPVPIQAWATEHIQYFSTAKCWTVVTRTMGGCQFFSAGVGSEYRFATQCGVAAMCVQKHAYRIPLGPPDFSHKSWSYTPHYQFFPAINVFGAQRIIATGEPWAPFKGKSSDEPSCLRPMEWYVARALDRTVPTSYPLTYPHLHDVHSHRHHLP